MVTYVLTSREVTPLTCVLDARDEVKTYPAPRRLDTRPAKKLTYKAERNAPCPCGSGKKFKHCHVGQ